MTEPRAAPKAVHDLMAGPVGGIMIEGQRSMQEELESLVQMKKQYNKMMVGGGVAITVLFVCVIVMMVSSPEPTTNAAEEAEIADLQAQLEAEEGAQAQELAELEQLRAEMTAGPNVDVAAGHAADRLRAGVPLPLGTSPHFCFGAQALEEAELAEDGARKGAIDVG